MSINGPEIQPADANFRIAREEGPASIALDFLRKLQPMGPWLLTAIIPDGSTATRTFTPDNVDPLRAFIKNYNGRHNLYYSINEPKGFPTKKIPKDELYHVL